VIPPLRGLTSGRQQDVCVQRCSRWPAVRASVCLLNTDADPSARQCCLNPICCSVQLQYPQSRHRLQLQYRLYCSVSSVQRHAALPSTCS
jgi:hypothetical protein